MNSQFLSTLLAAAAKRPYKRRVSYLESTGTQWIDTGIVPTTEQPVIKMKFTPTVSGDYDVCGFADNHSLRLHADFIPSYIRPRYGTGALASLGVVSVGSVTNLTLGKLTIVNGAEHEFSDQDFSANTNSIKIFSGRNNATIQVQLASVLLDNTLVRSYIPVLWHANTPYTDGNTGSSVTSTTDTPGMYDTVSKRLFVNQGTGQFLYSLAPTYKTYIPHPMNNIGDTCKTNPPVDGSKGVFIKSGSQLISARMTMVSATVESGQSQMVYNHGSALYTTIESGALLRVSSGGVALNTLASDRATLHASSGGLLLSCTVSGVSALVALNGGVASAVKIEGASGFLASCNINSGGTAINCVGGISANLFVNSGGTAIGCSENWQLIAYSGGLAISTIVNRRAYANAGGSIVSATVIGQPGYYCGLNAQVGGWVSGVLYTAPSGGVTISSGGTGYDIVMSGSGLLNHSSGGYVERAVINSGVSYALRGSASIITVSSGGRMTVYSGGTALAVTSNPGATVIVSDGGYIEYVTP